MKKVDNRFALYGNPITTRQTEQTQRWRQMFVRKFSFDPDETYQLSLKPNPHLGPLFGVKDILRQPDGETITTDNAVLISTIRMGYGHYRIAMAGASCAAAMGFTPLWLDLLAIPGITTDVIGWCNRWYSRFSRISQQSRLFNRWVWEPVTTGDPTLPGLSWLLNRWIVGWPWRFVKTNIKDYQMSQLFAPLHGALPPNLPILTSHMWNAMGAVAGGMSRVVDMVFDNWPMAFQLTEGAQHAIQSPSGYYGFRTMKGFGERGELMRPVPPEALSFAGHHVDHELVDNIETDCEHRLQRAADGQPRRLLLTMGGAGAQRELFREVLLHCLPLIRDRKAMLMINLGDHQANWAWLQSQLPADAPPVQLLSSWEEARDWADGIRAGSAEGLAVFTFSTTTEAVYTTNYLMRVADVMITKPSELSFYPIPKIMNERVGGHERWGAIRAAELGDGTVEVGTIPLVRQAIDLLVHETDLLEMYCDCIVKNKQIGIYDGGYRAVELATGTKFVRSS